MWVLYILGALTVLGFIIGLLTPPRKENETNDE